MVSFQLAGNQDSIPPFPPEHHGITWRLLTEDDLHALGALFARMEARDNPPYRTALAEVAEMLSSSTQWRGIVGIATKGMASGRMVAFAQTRLRASGRIECLCQGGVDPDFRRIGLGRALVDWQILSANAMLERYEGNSARAIVRFVENWQDDLEGALKSQGFHWERTYYDLRAKLRPLPVIPSLGSYISIEQWSPQWDEELRQAANSIAQQQGISAMTEEQWTMGRSSFVPEWSFIAVDRRSDRPRIAGFVLSSKYEQDWAALGWKEGYIDQIGVGDEWRTSRVLDALVATSMSAQAEDGMAHIATGIAQAEGSAMLSVFEYLGFRVVGQSRLYAIDVPEA